MAKYVGENALAELVAKIQANMQSKLVSGTNLKTINNTSLLGSGNISIGGGTATDVQVNGTSITSNNVANLITNTAYNSSTNKIATMSDISGKLSSSDLLTYVYPVGSIYMSTKNTSPALFLGGTWAQLKDTFLLAHGTTYTSTASDNTSQVTAEAGEATHTLTIDEMPSHNHQRLYWNGSAISFNSGTQNGYYFNWGSKQKGDGNYLTTGYTGGNSSAVTQAHNNMPPYLVVYMWKRTA